MKHILVVDDEKNIRDVVGAYLIKEGYLVSYAADGKEAMTLFDSESIDLIVLDLMLPKMSGEEVCATIRKRSKVPIIMLTAKVEDEDVISGIAEGADDYIRKPFSVRELMIRIHAIFRRLEADAPMMEVYRFGEDLVIDFDRMHVSKKQVELDLTPNEWKILKVLVANTDIVMSRDQIIEKTFGIQFEGYDRTIDTHIKNLRQKIEDDPKKPQYIKTIYSMGYKFSVPE